MIVKGRKRERTLINSVFRQKMLKIDIKKTEVKKI